MFAQRRMAMAMLTTLFFPASASEIEPYVGDRFEYYAVEDEDWKYVGTYKVTAEESKNIRGLEDLFFGIFSVAADKYVFGAGVVTDLVHDLIQECNLDYGDTGIYTVSKKFRTHYKRHLGTGQSTVDRREMIMLVVFNGGGKKIRREVTVTLR